MTAREQAVREALDKVAALSCEVHVPGRDNPSPWCAACRMAGARP